MDYSQVRNPLKINKTTLLIAKNTSWLTIGRLGGDLAGLGLFIILSRYYGPTGVGQYAFGLAISGLVYAIVSLNLDEYAIRELPYVDDRERKALLYKLSTIQAVMLFPLFVVLLVSSKYLGLSIELLKVTLILCIQQILTAFSRLYYSPSYVEQRMVRPAVTELSLKIGSVLCVIFLTITFDLQLSTVLYPLIVGSLLFLISSYSSLAELKGEGFGSDTKWNHYKKIINTAWPFAASMIMYFIYARANIILLSVIKGDEIAGMFATSMKFLEVAAMPIVFLGIATFPVINIAVLKKRQELGDIVDNYLRQSLILGGLVAWVSFFVFPTVLPILLGTEFSGAVDAIKLLSVLGILISIDVVAWKTLRALHLQHKQIKYQLIGTVLNVVFCLILIPKYGVAGAIVSLLGAYLGINSLYYVVIHKKLEGKSFLGTMIMYMFCVSTLLLGVISTLFIDADYHWLVGVVSLVSFLAVLLATGFANKQIRDVVRSY